MTRRMTFEIRITYVYFSIKLTYYTFQYNVLYLNEKLFKFKIVSSPLCSFCNLENETPILLFYSCNQAKSLWSKLQELLNSEILFLQNTPQSAFFDFPDNKGNFEIINHLHLRFKHYLFQKNKTRRIDGKYN